MKMKLKLFVFLSLTLFSAHALADDTVACAREVNDTCSAPFCHKPQYRLTVNEGSVAIYNSFFYSAGEDGAKAACDTKKVIAEKILNETASDEERWADPDFTQKVLFRKQ